MDSLADVLQRHSSQNAFQKSSKKRFYKSDWVMHSRVAQKRQVSNGSFERTIILNKHVSA